MAKNSWYSINNKTGEIYDNNGKMLTTGFINSVVVRRRNSTEYLVERTVERMCRTELRQQKSLRG